MATLDPSKGTPQAATQADLSQLRSREGQAAIYTENGVASHVHVDRVYCDGWGVEIEFTIVWTPGLVTGVGSSGEWNVKVGCCWELFHTGRSGWHSSGQGCNWSLFFDRQLIEELIQMGSEMHEKVPRSERLSILRKRLSRAYVEDLRRDGSVGPP